MDSLLDFEECVRDSPDFRYTPPGVSSLRMCRVLSHLLSSDANCSCSKQMFPSSRHIWKRYKYSGTVVILLLLCSYYCWCKYCFI